MRLALVSMMTMMAAALPAAAQTGLGRAPMRWQITPGSTTETSTLLTRRLRLRVDTPPASATRLFRLQQRYATAMIDLFPIEGTGFRFSAGTRYHVRRDFVAEGDGAARGLLFAPRFGNGGGSRRSGLNRFNPAVTMGYTEALGERVSLGLEMGERMGRAFARGPRVPRLGGIGPVGARGADRDFHPVASLTFGVAF